MAIARNRTAPKTTKPEEVAPEESKAEDIDPEEPKAEDTEAEKSDPEESKVEGWVKVKIVYGGFTLAGTTYPENAEVLLPESVANASEKDQISSYGSVQFLVV